MSYRAGIGDGMQRFGLTPCDPHIICDGCGTTRGVTARGGMVAANWFLNGKAAPGWRMTRVDRGDLGVERRDYCPDCKAKPAAERGERKR